MVNFLLILWDVDQVCEAQGFGTSRNKTRHFFCVFLYMHIDLRQQRSFLVVADSAQSLLTNEIQDSHGNECH